MKNSAAGKSWTRIVGQGLGIVLATFLLATGSAQASGGCTTAVIDEPFSLPDGSRHAGGMLTLCLERNHSPVAALHEVRVNGMGMGLFMSRRDSSEGLLDPHARPALPFMMFHRINGGELSLVGVASPRRDRMQLHFLGYSTRRDSRIRQDLFAIANDSTLVIVQAQTL